MKSNSIPGWLCAVVTLLGPASGHAQPEPGPFRSAQGRAHYERALTIAGADLRADAIRLCRPQPVRPMVGPPPPAGAVVLPPRPRSERPAFPPVRAFDNIWYFGTSEVGATVVRTSRGLVVVDALTTAEDAERVLVGGMLAASLDPAAIRYVIVTHAHGDHHGGLATLRRHSPGLRIVMSRADWDFARKPFYMPDGNLDTAPKAPPFRAGDIRWTDRLDLSLGDTTFHLLETPGHTPGTTALVYTVRNGPRRETVAQWGGGSPMDRLFSTRSVKRFAALALAQGATVQWSSHSGPGFWGTVAGNGSARPGDDARAGSPSNFFLAGRPLMKRYLDVLVECKKASVLD